MDFAFGLVVLGAMGLAYFGARLLDRCLIKGKSFVPVQVSQVPVVVVEGPEASSLVRRLSKNGIICVEQLSQARSRVRAACAIYLEEEKNLLFCKEVRRQAPDALLFAVCMDPDCRVLYQRYGADYILRAPYSEDELLGLLEGIL